MGTRSEMWLAEIDECGMMFTSEGILLKTKESIYILTLIVNSINHIKYSS